MTMQVKKTISIEEELPGDAQDYLIVGTIALLKDMKQCANKKSILETVNATYTNRIYFSEKQVENSLKRLEKSGNVSVTMKRGEKTYQTPWKQL
jgi:hypothetical protein